MKQFIILLAFFIAFTSVDAQKKHKTNKRTSRREINKRLDASDERSQTNKFNKLHRMGSRANDARDDLLWHSESANTVYHKSGSVSLTSPSRYGLKNNLELTSILPLNYWVPNLGIKKRWRNDVWYVASRHCMYSATPGFNWAQKQGYTDYVSPTQEVPFVLSMRNELMVSRLFTKDHSCTKDKPYLIITLGLGIDYGYAFGDSTIKELDGHFLTNRSPALTGKGGYGYVKGRADWQINSSFILGGGIRYYRGDFTGGHAYEHALDVQMFLFPQLSFTAGYMASYGKHTTGSDFGILPFVDLTLHFGRKQTRSKGLWDQKMF